ncbi:MAG TPA: MauE/DoxX family redox-associated membrane protein [Planctomycetota bacterium]
MTDAPPGPDVIRHPSGARALTWRRLWPAFDALLLRALGAVFLLAARGKLADLEGFEETIARFGIVLDGAVRATAVALAVVEVGIGAALLVGWRKALHGATALLVLFLGVLAYGLWLGLDVDCGCFGPGEHVGLATALGRDLVLLAVSGYLYWRRPGRRKEVA